MMTCPETFREERHFTIFQIERSYTANVSQAQGWFAWQEDPSMEIDPTFLMISEQIELVGSPLRQREIQRSSPGSTAREAEG
jgi:hypothetical protein